MRDECVAVIENREEVHENFFKGGEAHLGDAHKDPHQSLISFALLLPFSYLLPLYPSPRPSLPHPTHHALFFSA